MSPIFEYKDYRVFLQDFYRWKKENNRAFSFRLFADKAGFRSKSFIQDVISGKKNVSEDSINKLQKVLKLTEEEFAYFNDLIAFNQSKTLAERNHFIELLDSKKREKSLALLKDSQYEYFTSWYHNAIREIITKTSFDGDYLRLAEMLEPSITPKEAEESVLLLQSLGLIQYEDGTYRSTEALLTTGDEVSSTAVLNFHMANLELSKEKINSTPREERDISSIVVGLSEEGFRRYKAEVQKFRKELLHIAESEHSIDKIYHLNFQLIPVTTNLDTKGADDA